MALQPKLDNTAASSRRLQIRGFPTIWVEKLNFDEIGWILFDLLAKVGPIDNIAVTQSKKSSIVFGVVDMKHKKDAQRVFSELLNDKGHLPLEEWKSTLQFKLLEMDIEQLAGGQQQQTPSPLPPPPPPLEKPVPLREIVANLSAVSTFATKIGAEFGQLRGETKMPLGKEKDNDDNRSKHLVSNSDNNNKIRPAAATTSSGVDASSLFAAEGDANATRYGRDQMLKLRENAPSEYHVQDQFLEAYCMCQRDRDPLNKDNRGGGGNDRGDRNNRGRGGGRRAPSSFSKSGSTRSALSNSNTTGSTDNGPTRKATSYRWSTTNNNNTERASIGVVAKEAPSIEQPAATTMAADEWAPMEGSGGGGAWD